MKHDLNPYPAYKDAGVPTLRKVPEHWPVQRIKRIALSNPGKSEARDALSLDIRATFLPMERVSADGRIDSRESRPASALWTGFTYFRRADVIVAKITPCFENGKGACLDQLPTSIGFGSTEFHVLRAGPQVLPRYLYRLTTLPEFRRLGADAMTGAAGQQRVPQSFVENFPVGLPPVSEQLAIIRFLDYLDRQIRRYIRAKQNVIALLNEQKQAIINSAVTRGLDPNVRLKPSGEWLGDVPEHWEVLRTKQLFREVDDRSKTGTEVLLSLRMNRGLVPHKQVSSVPITSEALIGFKKVIPGQVVMNRMRAAIGMFAVAHETGLVSPDYAVFEPHNSVNPEYFVQVFKTRAARAVFRIESKGLGTGSSGFMRLYTDRFGTIKLPVPPSREQSAILLGIADETADIDRTADRVSREVTLAREYRTRLVADLVTGQLDVREAVVNLPEEREETEPGGEEFAPEDGEDENSESRAQAEDAEASDTDE